MCEDWAIDAPLCYYHLKLAAGLIGAPNLVQANPIALRGLPPSEQLSDQELELVDLLRNNLHAPESMVRQALARHRQLVGV